MEDKGVHTFPDGICPKVNVIARLEYELAYYDSEVHHFNHYTTRTFPPPQKKKKQCKVYIYGKKFWKKFFFLICIFPLFIDWPCWRYISRIQDWHENKAPPKKTRDLYGGSASKFWLSDTHKTKQFPLHTHAHRKDCTPKLSIFFCCNSWN